MFVRGRCAGFGRDRRKVDRWNALLRALCEREGEIAIAELETRLLERLAERLLVARIEIERILVVEGEMQERLAIIADRETALYVAHVRRIKADIEDARLFKAPRKNFRERLLDRGGFCGRARRFYLGGLCLVGRVANARGFNRF